MVGRARCADVWVLSVFVCGRCQAVSNIVCARYVFRPCSTHTGAPRARARARVARLGCVGFDCRAGARVLRVCAGRVCKNLVPQLLVKTAFVQCALSMWVPPTRAGGRVGTAMLLCGGAPVLIVLVCDRVSVGCTSCAGVCVLIVCVWALSIGSWHCVFTLCFSSMINTYGHATRAGSRARRAFTHGGACARAPPACNHARGWRYPSLGLANAPWLWA